MVAGPLSARLTHSAKSDQSRSKTEFGIIPQSTVHLHAPSTHPDRTPPKPGLTHFDPHCKTRFTTHSKHPTSPVPTWSDFTQMHATTPRLAPLTRAQCHAEATHADLRSCASFGSSFSRPELF